jgi:hypothetical protein
LTEARAVSILDTLIGGRKPKAVAPNGDSHKTYINTRRKKNGRKKP